MKVNFQYGLAGYTGKADGLVFCFSKELGRVYARRNTYPRLTAENERVGSITSQLFAIKPGKAFQDDLFCYRIRYNALRENHQHPMRSWSALYLKMMYNMAKADPSINLRTLTREEIYTRNLPCISVKKAVEAGLLPVVYDYSHLDREM
jgi:hypothetical protein